MLVTQNESIEEKWTNILTHGLGLLFSVGALVYFLCKLQILPSVTLKIGVLLFTCSMIFVYFSSTLYHLIDLYRPEKILGYRKLDHMSIYTLIAGTQTPFIILYLEDAMAIKYLLLLWTLALAGLIFKFFFLEKYEKLAVGSYLGLGWLVVIVIPSMFQSMDIVVFYWILAGGLAYSVGVFFYLREQMKFNHAIWHLFVLGGSATHFVALLYALS